MIRFRILLLLAFSQLSLLAFAQQQWPQPDCENPPKEFKKQYEEIFHAYKKSDEEKMKAAVDGFQIPPDWFVAEFGKDKGGEMQKQYADQFTYYRWETLRKLHWINSADDSEVEFEVCHKTSNWPTHPAPDSLQPLPVGGMVMTRYLKKNGTFAMFGRANMQTNNVSWGDFYVQIDGRYRFLGTGGHPFWDPTCVAHADMCAKPGEITGGVVTKRVEPNQQVAQLAKKQGTVMACLSVAKDGSVTKVEILEGDPVLAPAAQDALTQWRFTPFMNCGQAVDMRVMKTVKFPPSE
jgi:TonB family protein